MVEEWEVQLSRVHSKLEKQIHDLDMKTNVLKGQMGQIKTHYAEDRNKLSNIVEKEIDNQLELKEKRVKEIHKETLEEMRKIKKWLTRCLKKFTTALSLNTHAIKRLEKGQGITKSLVDDFPELEKELEKHNL